MLFMCKYFSCTSNKNSKFLPVYIMDNGILFENIKKRLFDVDTPTRDRLLKEKEKIIENCMSTP